MKNHRIWLGIAASFSVGCASLMMHTTELDKGQEGVRLEKGDPVAVPAPSFAAVVSDKADAAKLAADLRAKIIVALKNDGIRVDDTAPNKIVVDVTKYETGCGFCRGFFPVFGLGNSYVDGKATLEAENGKRTILIEKTGQASGMSQMGDQTDTNMDYFAEVLTSHLATAPRTEETADSE